MNVVRVLLFIVAASILACQSRLEISIRYILYQDGILRGIDQKGGRQEVAERSLIYSGAVVGNRCTHRFSPKRCFLMNANISLDRSGLPFAIPVCIWHSRFRASISFLSASPKRG